MADSKPPNPLPVKPPTQGGSLPLSFNRGPPGTSYGGGGKYYTISSLLSNTIAQKTMYRNPSTQKPYSLDVKPQSIIKINRKVIYHC